jgi:uncharacterized protein YlxW (UPF0749 family)
MLTANRNRLLTVACALLFGGLTVRRAAAQQGYEEPSQAPNSYQSKIDDLQSQVDQLQDSVEKNLEDAQRFDQNADQ